MRFMNDFLDLLWTFNILVVNTKIAYTESEIMKGKKMLCCFERDFSAGRKEEARALNALRITGKASWRSSLICTGEKCFI